MRRLLDALKDVKSLVGPRSDRGGVPVDQPANKTPERLGAVAHRSAVKGVLRNFLGTYTSRYSDYGGYWLFGFLVNEIEKLQVDLLKLEETPAEATPRTTAIQLARQKFAEQMGKARISLAYVREAHLEITKSSPTLGVRRGKLSPGYKLTFVARAVSDHGKKYESSLSLFVAPHDPAIERQSSPATADPVLPSPSSHWLSTFRNQFDETKGRLLEFLDRWRSFRPTKRQLAGSAVVLALLLLAFWAPHHREARTRVAEKPRLAERLPSKPKPQIDPPFGFH